MRRRVARFGRNAHQPAQRRTEAGAAGADERVGLGAGDAGLLRLVADIDLHIKVGQPTVPLRRLRDRLGQPHPVEAFDRVRDPHRFRHLVGLQCSDQMQPQCRMRGDQGRKLRRRFLHPVLAEHRLPGRQRRRDRGRRVGFRDRDQRDIMRVAPGRLRRGGDAGAHAGKAGRDRLRIGCGGGRARICHDTFGARDTILSATTTIGERLKPSPPSGAERVG